MRDASREDDATVAIQAGPGGDRLEVRSGGAVADQQEHDLASTLAQPGGGPDQVADALVSDEARDVADDGVRGGDAQFGGQGLVTATWHEPVHIHAVRDDRDALGVDAAALEDVGAHRLGQGDDAGRSAHACRFDRPHGGVALRRLGALAHLRDPGLLEEAADLVHNGQGRRFTDGQRDLGVHVVRRRLEQDRPTLGDEVEQSGRRRLGDPLDGQSWLEPWRQPVVGDPIDRVAGADAGRPLVTWEPGAGDHLRIQTDIPLAQCDVLGPDPVARRPVGQRVGEQVQDPSRCGLRPGRERPDRRGRQAGAPRGIQQGEFGFDLGDHAGPAHAPLQPPGLEQVGPGCGVFAEGQGEFAAQGKVPGVGRDRRMRVQEAGGDLGCLEGQGQAGQSGAGAARTRRARCRCRGEGLGRPAAGVCRDQQQGGRQRMVAAPARPGGHQVDERLRRRPTNR